MLVDVVKMRLEGRKLSQEELQDVEPRRGRLSIKTRPWNASGRMHDPKELTPFASLYDHLEDDPIAEPMWELRGARVNSLDGDEFVIVGLERSGLDTYERDDPQAWWCRRVNETAR